MFLSPEGESGLDDWNHVLDIVRIELGRLPIEPDAAYVSHQAGTPAISSAVQFASLAKFRNNVQFIVSNEYSQKVRTIPRSTYLRGIQCQEAKALLNNFDYPGIEQLLEPELLQLTNPIA